MSKDELTTDKGSARRAKVWNSFAFKSRTLFLLLLSLAVLPALYAVVQTKAALQEDEKANGAQAVLNLHIDLAKLGHGMEKELAASGTLDTPAGRKLVATKNTLVGKLRLGIASEIEIRGRGGYAEEGGEFANVEMILNAMAVKADGSLSQGWSDLIDQAIDHEREELDEIDQAEKFALQSSILALSISAAFVLVIFIGAIFWLDRSIGLPMLRMRQATNLVADGVPNVRLPKMRDTEFDLLAKNFNRMADALERRHNVLETNSTQLEELVNKRTSELKNTNKELVRIAGNRKQFLTDISHELRTPLAIIRGDAEVTLRGGEKPTSEYQAALSRIAAQITGLTRLVDDLLYVARNEDGAPSVQLRPVELLRIINHAGASIRPLLEDVDGKLAISSDIDHARIVGDEQRLGQLMNILLDNAIQYSNGPPEIAIDVLHATDGYMLQVQDKGMGISAIDLSSVFDRFHRGKIQSVKNDGGMGIGLPMAKAIVEAHGGSISIKSTLDDGTTVSVFLPAAQKLKVIHEHIGG